MHNRESGFVMAFHWQGERLLTRALLPRRGVAMMLLGSQANRVLRLQLVVGACARMAS
eukprot:NODE_15560_length_1043_cov_7.847162.p5 GENE.NODE_15560_length_1043_cov_7.847162~~NODE_15560_length_1043_cov_7.847162.p5  ORF type:complete len:58 (-),score=9.66 NODE_15560_length_1043_cov_7.847162:802-975(-)